MREIKFRAWDDSISKMLYWEDLLSVTTEGRSFFGLQSIFKGESHHYHLEQFTGLHDKNGREIYDGDRLELCVDGSPSVIFTVVKYETGFEFDNRKPGARLWHAAKNCKIIGNIHESPELLDAK
jgi:uncharacterized phage protein (TIGR01671 family)